MPHRPPNRIKDIHQLDMLRLRVSGVKGTPAQLSRLLEPWGITIKAATIRQWAKRVPVHPTGADGNAPVYLIWDVWQAHARLPDTSARDATARSRRQTTKTRQDATERDRFRRKRLRSMSRRPLDDTNVSR